MADERAAVIEQPPLLQLPLEIVNLIAVRYLSPSDYKSLRLTSRLLDSAMIELLFRRVYLSKTKLDCDKFFSIAGHPHLATAARELYWYELAEDETVFTGLDAQRKADEMKQKPDEDHFKIPDLMTLARQAFWLPSEGSSTEYHEAHPKEALKRLRDAYNPVADGAFFSRFLSALKAMPTLHTFVSCPMPPWRVISTIEYPLTAQMFQRGLGWRHQNANDGFFKFLLRAMRSSESTIRRLALADELGESCLSRFRPSHMRSFKRLTHLAFNCGYSTFPDLEDLGLCLREATELVQLTVCLTSSRLDQPNGDGWSARGLFGLQEITCWWPNLQTLELTEIRIDKVEPRVVLVNLIKAHSATLRHLAFRQCCVNRAFLRAVAEVPGLQLRSLIIQEENTGTGITIIPESDLVAYLNGKGPIPFNSRGDPDDYWDTCLTAFYPDAAPTQALFDASSGNSHLYSKEDLSVILNSLHYATPPLLQSGLSLFAREKRAKEMVSLGTGSSKLQPSNPKGFITETVPVSRWLFKHPDGSEAVGDEPLEFWSDWEDSFDETSDEEALDDGSNNGFDDENDTDVVGTSIEVVNNDAAAAADDGDDDDDSEYDGPVSDSECSEFDGAGLVDEMESSIPLLEKRFQAIPLWH
jgi:hypothetical protein